MEPYHKIQSVFKRDPATKHKTFLNEYSTPEFEYLKDNTWVFTEKVDGTNIRVISWPCGKVTFRGRTENSQIPTKLVSRLMKLFPPHEKLHEQFPDGGCLYGEGCGAGIQKGGGNYYSNFQEFVLFDARVGIFWLKRDAVMDIACKLEVHIAPIIGSGTLDDMVKLVCGGLRSCWGDFIAEGAVARPETELFNRGGHRIIAKLKHKDFQMVDDGSEVS